MTRRFLEEIRQLRVWVPSMTLFQEILRSCYKAIGLLSASRATVTVQTGLRINLIPGGQARLDEFLLEQEMEIEREAEDYEIYPVARFAVIYRF